MKNLLWAVAMVTFAQTTYAQPFAEIKGLGKDREHLTPELITERTRLLQENSDFFLLRDPKSLSAPGQIFDPKIWSIITQAAADNELDPFLLGAVIFIESYGDPLAKSPTGPAGIGQLTKSSAKEMGLSMDAKVQIGTKTETKTIWVGQGKDRHKETQTKEVPVYIKKDERYIPERAIPAIARRLNNRRAWLGGKLDFAIAEYHMGAGRISKLLSAYFGKRIKLEDIPKVMRASPLTYDELFWTNTPYYRQAVYEEIAKLMKVDFSPTYRFNVGRAMDLLREYRDSPKLYLARAQKYQGRFGKKILPNLQWSFATEEDLDRLSLKNIEDLRGEMQTDEDRYARIVRLPQIAYEIGIKVRTSGKSPIAETDLANQELYIAAERSTIGCMMFVTQKFKELEGKKFKGAETNSMVRHLGNQTALRNEKGNLNAQTELPTHTFGWAFDLPRGGMNKDQVRDWNFTLTDLRYAGLLAFIEEGVQKTFHVVRDPDHVDMFEDYYWQAVATPLPVKASN